MDAIEIHASLKLSESMSQQSKSLRQKVIIFLLLILSVCIWTYCPEAQEHILILHWNDFHAQNLPILEKVNGSWVKVGGAATLKAYIEKLKAEGLPTAIVHAGDEFQGTPISTITKGKSQIELLNLFDIDVMTLGNHEFDYGRDVLQQRLKEAQFPIISANIFDKRNAKLFVSPYYIEKIGKVKIGFIGLITKELPFLTLPRNVAGLKILSPEMTARQYIHLLKDSVDVIVVVSHMGIEADRRLAQKVAGIDVIIGGHSHTVLTTPELVNGTIICQAGSHGRYLGRVDLWVDTLKDTVLSFKGQLIPTVVENILPDSVVLAKVQKLEQEVDRELNVVIGTLERDWVRNSRGESNIGNWLADVMRDYAQADVAFQNSGGIRKDLKAGPITKRDIWEIAPFSNHFVVFEVTGSELKSILEHNISGRGSFLQTSGVEVEYDPGRPRGQRILSVKVKGRVLQSERKYLVVANNYMTENFYRIFHLPPHNRNFRSLPKLDRDVFIEAVQQQRVLDGKLKRRYHAVSTRGRW
ncbi:bifunctional metallophosphatase/5'-nucleotidase [bacterium]|nr:bifunctional metallophosphatase/5'-nucleotidase [bacterium]